MPGSGDPWLSPVELSRRASSRFAHSFRDAPLAGAIAPGRVNLIGDHTDYHQGLVLPVAIDRWTVAVGSLRLDGKVRWAHEDLESLEHSPSDQPPTAGTSMSYIVGSVRCVARALHRPQLGLDLALASSLPIGAGLASSAALELAVITLIHRLVAGRGAPAMDPGLAANLARRAEHEWAGVACGPMDQAIIAHAAADHALRIDCQDGSMSPVAWPKHASLIVLNSGVRHTLADGFYASLQRAGHRASQAMDLPSLRLATPVHLARCPHLDEDARLAAQHVVAENGRVEGLVHALAGGDLRAAGRLMLDSHTSLKDLARVSCDELDRAVALAMSCPGVLGARMTGAGMGGCAVVLTDTDLAPAVLAQLIELAPRRVHPKASAMIVRPAGCAKSL